MDGWNTRQAFQDLPPGYFLLPADEFSVSFNFHQGRQRVRVRATQFPVVHARCVTGHKAQGTTVPAVLILGFAKTARSGFTSWTYVCGLFYEEYALIACQNMI